MTTETTVTYSADETTKAARFVANIVIEARAKAQEALAAKHAEERERAAKTEQERANLETMARASLPEDIRAFVSVYGYAWKYRAIVSLPDCAPFGIDIHAGALTRLFYPATCYDGDEGQYEPYLEISSSGTYSTLADEIARAYEAQTTYNKALDMWQHAQAEREHAQQMSERESALRHEEEPEPMGYSGQRNDLHKLTDTQILRMVEECIEAADLSLKLESMNDNGRAYYFLARAKALSDYVTANNSGYLASIADN